MKRINEAAIVVAIASSIIASGFDHYDVDKELNIKKYPPVHKEIQYTPNLPTMVEFMNSNNKKVEPSIEPHITIHMETEKIIKDSEDEKRKEEFINFINMVRYNDTTQIDLRKPSGLTEELANELLKGTGLEGLGKAFVEAEHTYSVNAYYLMAHAAWESEWGKSKLARNKNNLFGYQAYDSNPYHSARVFSSKGESIMTVAKYIGKHYLNSTGDHYNGHNLSGMNIKYASDKNWARGIGDVIDKLALKSADMKGV